MGVSSGAGIIWTFGHSTRSWEEFRGLLAAHGIELLADVRAFPGSRRWPQFGREALEASLAKAGIGYEHMSGLGGRRKPAAGSRNTGWRNESFRAYADYMETREFAAAAARLEDVARKKRTAIMCAEALWWRCHRALISDWLKWRGWTVLHIAGEGKAQEHPYTRAAAIVDGELSYAGGGQGLFG
jgi:uncharacterized protein (DUF488 family)